MNKDELWQQFRAEHGPRPGGRRAQEVWESKWKDYQRKHKL